MIKIYCTQCGSPNEYSVKKPKFCEKCGESFGSFSTSISSTQSSLKNKQLEIKKTYIHKEIPKTIIEEIDGVKRLIKVKPRKSYQKEIEEDYEEYDENLVSDLFDAVLKDSNKNEVVSVDKQSFGHATFKVGEIASKGVIGFKRKHKKQAKKSKNQVLKEFDKQFILKKESIGIRV